MIGRVIQAGAFMSVVAAGMYFAGSPIKESSYTRERAVAAEVDDEPTVTPEQRRAVEQIEQLLTFAKSRTSNDDWNYCQASRVTSSGRRGCQKDQKEARTYLIQWLERIRYYVSQPGAAKADILVAQIMQRCWLQHRDRGTNWDGFRRCAMGERNRLQEAIELARQRR